MRAGIVLQGPGASDYSGVGMGCHGTGEERRVWDLLGKWRQQDLQRAGDECGRKWRMKDHS